jgi:O-antigen ligase
MDNLVLGLIAANILVAAAGLALWCRKRYEIAIFLVALSPVISAAFFDATVVDVDPDALSEPVLGSYLRIGLVSLIGAVGLFRFIEARARDRKGVPVQLLLLGVFLLFALASTSYSIDQQYTFIRSASFLALFGFLLGLYSWIDSEQRLNQTLFALFVMVCLVTLMNIVALVAMPGRAWDDNRFVGLWPGPNSMGSFCMLAYPIVLWVYARCTPFKKWIVAFLIVSLICLHLLTGSRGSLEAAVLGICMWSVVQQKPLRVLLLLGAIGIGAFILSQVRPSSFEREAGYTATDLTERPEFWLASLTLITERPILGYGYQVEGGVWSDPRFNQPKFRLWSGSARSSLHNGYLSVAVGLGLGGLLLWCAILFIPLWRFRRLPYSDYKGLVLAIMFSSLILNCIESNLGGTDVVFWIVWVIAERVSSMFATPEQILVRVGPSLAGGANAADATL